MLLSLALPTLFLMVLAVAVPRGLERLLSETLGGIVLNAVVSALVLWVLSAALFGVLYLWRAAEVAPMLGTGGGIAHLAVMGAKAAMIWLPLMLLTVMTAPRRWRVNTW